MDTDLLQDDLLLLGQFAQFPHKMTGRAIAADELHQFFGTRNIDDLIEALQQRESGGYLEFEMKLSPIYLEHERRRADRADINGPWHYDEHYGLGRLYDKVDTQSPLAAADVSYLAGKLPASKFEQYLQFTFTRIDRQKFQDELDKLIAKRHKPVPNIAPGVSVRRPRIPEFKILNGQSQQANASVNKPVLEPGDPTPISKKLLNDLRLNVKSYDPVNKTLYFGQPIPILVQKRTKKSDKETQECRLVRMLFKNVKTLKRGLNMTSFTSVKNGVLSNAEKKRISNYVTQINKKIKDVTEVENLIYCDGNKVKVDTHYL